MGIIFGITTIGLICGIRQLNLGSYFALPEKPDEEREELTPKEPSAKYTEDNSENGYESSNSEHVPNS